MSEEEQKPASAEITKSSMEILSELFSTFDAEPPVIVKKEKDPSGKKHKKSKKKHKHKDKKHKKKEKKRKRSASLSSNNSAIDLAELLIKRERQSPEKKIKIDSLLLDEKEEEESKAATLKDLKLDSVIEAIIKDEKVDDKKRKYEGEDGEITSSGSCVSDAVNKKRHKRKRKHEDKKSKKRSHNEEKKSKKLKTDEKRSKSKEKKNKGDEKKDKSDEKRSKSRERKVKSPIRWSKEKNGSDHKSKDKDRGKYDDDYKSRDDFYRDRRDNYRSSRSYDDYKHRYRENPFYKSSDDSKGRSSHEKDDKWFTRDRYRGYNEYEKDRGRRYRDRSNSRESENHIDKKKLLEIARRNTIQMMKSGSLPAALTLGPQAQEKVLAAIKAGGKTIEELTEFCKTLSQKEELGELSSNSAGEDRDDSDVESKAFHHPFQLKDRPTSIIMNIKNSVPLPTKTAQERNSDLRLQFPVSSGTHHRKTENEWVPVTPKKVEAQLPASKAPPVIVPAPAPLAIEAAPPVIEPLPPVIPTSSALPGPQVFPIYTDLNINNIGAIVSQRLSAMRRLQENPHDVEAVGELNKAQKEMQSWVESKQQPGQFTGSTGANILSQAELASGYQTWAKKDQLQNAAPVSGGMGMHLLRKMGWNPGEGLGKEKTGTLEPLLLEVKLNKKGLVASEEQKRKGQKGPKPVVKSLESKHPVSLLGEFTAKKKLGAPEYTLCMESGPDHKKMFLFQVSVNGMECKPEIASPNKKQAKADAARLCLQRLGILI